MKKCPWCRLSAVVATVLALTVLSAACGDDDDDSDEGDNDEECVAYDECTQYPALSDELSVMAFEVDPEPECAAFGLDVEVLEVRATESRGRGHPELSIGPAEFPQKENVLCGSFS